MKSKAVSILDPGQLEMLQSHCLEATLSKGETVFREGARPEKIVFLREGFAKLHKKGIRGRDQILKIARPGSYIGLQSVLGGNPGHYSASALTVISTCLIDIDVFKELILKNGGFATEILNFISNEELGYFQRFIDLNQKQLPGRLADALICLSDEIFHSTRFELPFTKNDLAALIGSTRESVTRTLKDFNDDGILEVSGRNIRILNVEKLHKISRTG